MPAELLAKADELRKNGTTGSVGARDPKVPRTNGPVQSGREDTFERLLRFSLYNQNTLNLENLQCGSNVVLIVHCGRIKNNLQTHMKFYDDSRPELSQEDRLKGNFKPHPLGDRKVKKWMRTRPSRILRC